MKTADHILTTDRFDAVVFDLDGVVTRTARVHAAAWKQMFDEFLAQRDVDQAPFDITFDYPEFVDGKARHDGVRSFLHSRGIELPDGEPGDAAERETVYGLGRRKDELFRDTLRSDGVAVYESSVEFLRTLRGNGIATAVVSSSRNCSDVLEAAGIVELFDARVDGRELERLGLAGKPAPDMFVEATRLLGTDVQRTAGIEDASAGVEAAKAAGLALVIGVDRNGRAGRLRAAGADLVVRDLAELRLQHSGEARMAPARLASALHCIDDIVTRDHQELAVFLDYDGTLTPIVSRPEDAVLADSVRSTLQRLAKRCAVAILSGRDLVDVRKRVGIPDIWYGGSHGFDIAGPAGEHMELPEGASYLPVLDAAERELHAALDPVPGCLVERKRFAIAVHYRLAADADVARAGRSAEETQAAHPELKLSAGKMVFELQPDIPWHKGKALRWLMQTLNMDPSRVVPVYIGDDQTDEDAFAELAPDGIGILVAETDRPTGATYRLDDPEAVKAFLTRIADALERR